jgi:hypothetical protein
MGGGPGKGDKTRALYAQLQPNNYATIRPASLGPQQIYPTVDSGKEIREAKQRESEALELYKKEIQMRKNQVGILEETMANVLKAREPMRIAESSVPLRANDFDQFPPDLPQRMEARKQPVLLVPTVETPSIRTEEPIKTVEAPSGQIAESSSGGYPKEFLDREKMRAIERQLDREVGQQAKAVKKAIKKKEEEAKEAEKDEKNAEEKEKNA